MSSQGKSSGSSTVQTMQTTLFNKSLSTMVKGIRSHKSENGGSRQAEQEYINKCIQEIKNELKTNFPDVKAVAIQKLIYVSEGTEKRGEEGGRRREGEACFTCVCCCLITHPIAAAAAAMCYCCYCYCRCCCFSRRSLPFSQLQMIGYDISWSSFHIVELMSASWFGHKRVAYLAAALTFTQNTDVLVLTTHLFRKSFNSSGAGPAAQPISPTGFAALTGGGSMSANILSAALAEGMQYEAGAALSCLACIVTPDLAEQLLSDVLTLLNSSRPYIRKKAVLTLLAIFKVWPKALRLSFDRLKEKLEDESPMVVSAAVYVICELAAKNPKNYLALAPQFFKILTCE